MFAPFLRLPLGHKTQDHLQIGNGLSGQSSLLNNDPYGLKYLVGGTGTPHWVINIQKSIPDSP